jgi:hypothetical protein
MARKMLSRQVVIELLIIKEVFLAEFTPGMWQYLRLFFIPWVAVVDVRSQEVNVVESLLLDEDEAALEADLAEGLLVLSLQMVLKGILGGELMSGIALVDEALELSRVLTSLLNLLVFIIDVTVLVVSEELFFEVCLLELLIVQALTLCNQYLLAHGLADGALEVLHDEAQPQDTGVAHVLVVALTQSEVLHIVEAEDAVLFVGEV